MAKISVTIDSKQDLILVVVTGKITRREIIDTISQYSKEPHTNKVLWNYIEADGSEITSDDMRSIHHHAQSLFANEPNRKIATVVGRQLGFGLSRMGETLGEFENPDIKYRTFYTVQEALEWLNE